MTCDIQDNVVGLDLSDNNLRGSVPTEVGDLTALTSWALPTNLVTGALPSELGSMTVLNSLVMSSNELTVRLPTELGALTNLNDKFAVNYNDLSGPIPTQLGSLTLLTSHFQLQHNSITGSLPSELGMLSLTDTFQLHTNRLCGTIPAEVAALSGRVTSGWSVIAGNHVGPTPCAATLALVNLYTATTGATCATAGCTPDWHTGTAGLASGNRQNWMLGDPCAAPAWYRVSCSADSNVVDLDLSGHDLVGFVPTWIGGLTALTSD